jgi:hypothetical protein
VAGLTFSPDKAQRFMYLADYGNSHVIVMDRKSLTILYQFGIRSAAPGDFQGPHHIASSSKGDLVVVEVAPGNRVQRFRFKGLSSTLPPNALTPAQLAASPVAPAQAAPAPTAPQSSAPRTFPGPGSPQGRGGYPTWTSTMANPYRVTPNWPQLGDIKPGAAIGIIPDGKGGTWLHHRSEPPILHIDASGKVDRRFGNGMFVQAHGFCQDRDGNFWAGDSGPFQDSPATKGRGFQLFKFSPDGKVLLTLGKAGVSKADKATTFIGPDRLRDCAERRDHRGRRALAASDRRAAGRRSLVRIKTDGTFVAEYGKLGSGPASSWGRTRSRSIRRGGCSWRTVRTTASRSSTATCSSWTSGALRPSERHRDPERRHRHRGGFRIEPDHRRAAAGARGGWQSDPQPRMGQRHPDRQREGRVAALLRSGHAPRRAWARTTRATSLPGSRETATRARRAAACRNG